MALRRPGADPLIGRVFKDTYRVQELIGQGGMGRIYGGEHLRLKKPIVIKVIGDELKGSEEIVARFRKEAILQAMVNHPSAVQTIDLDEAEDGTLYIVGEHAEGEPLERVLSANGPFPTERATDIILQMLEILSVAHEAKIIHRDLKPENILIEQRGDKDIVRILDFGIAVLLDSDGQRARRANGTPFYMAPEQAAGESVDGRADLYSLGVIYYQMITGDLPVEDDNLDQFFVKLLNDYPAKFSESHPELEVPQDVEDTIFTCLSKDPFNRYESASDMLAKLSGTEGKKTRSFLVIAGVAITLAVVAMGFLFIPGDNYSSADEDAANIAMDGASKTHPTYATAKERYDSGLAKKSEGLYGEAYQLFESARRGFADCIAYSDTKQKAAEALLATDERTRPTHPMTALGRDSVVEGNKMVTAGRYEHAYRKFEQASVYLSYDSKAEIAATAAREGAAQENPSFAVGERLYHNAMQIFDKRPLVKDDLDLAERKFADAQKEFARAVVYNEELENAAKTAQQSADTMHPSYQKFSKMLGDAAFARSQNDYARAYELFGLARDGFLSIAGKYDSARQLAAESARATADPLSPLYSQAQAAYEAGQAARKSGDYTTAYAKFDQAAGLFSRAISFDPIHMQGVEQARVRADDTHPRYSEGEAAYQAGLRKKEAGDYAGADRDFIRATDLFNRAKPYDSRAERAAARAKKRAYSGLPITFPAAEAAWKKAVQAKMDKDYQTAYRNYEEAGDYYKQAKFDEDVLDDLAANKKRADPAKPEYVTAQRYEDDGQRAFAEGDGPEAEKKYEKASSNYRLAKKVVVRRPDDNAGKPAPGPDPQSKAKGAARRSKSDADDLAARTSDWNNANKITRQTQSYYQDGIKFHKQGTTAFASGDYIAAKPLFDDAVKALTKVSTQGR